MAKERVILRPSPALLLSTAARTTILTTGSRFPIDTTGARAADRPGTLPAQRPLTNGGVALAAATSAATCIRHIPTAPDKPPTEVSGAAEQKIDDRFAGTPTTSTTCNR
ncbi:hypothetical protein ACLMAL_37030 [Nocardia sp. CWNU-33]|uniref:hypothetical protein n=1 Tax=Nocardia sp. CWNU-33 TaxID=3392117 RepID=UPI00398EB202